MGQSDVIEFLEREYYKNSDRKFTKKEIEDGIERTIKDYSLITLTKNREIYREVDEEAIKLGHRKYRYRYIPNGNVIIRSLPLRFKGK